MLSRMRDPPACGPMALLQKWKSMATLPLPLRTSRQLLSPGRAASVWVWPCWDWWVVSLPGVFRCGDVRRVRL